jgi:hypothetical protein
MVWLPRLLVLFEEEETDLSGSYSMGLFEEVEERSGFL